ncbi:DEKNAAC102354 [Brettanomyces naardenensis]|uniref:DEKNAAC102354 n=1 Tax=Brettanomyces naardenensis TaxID=13370 RepID=A0A448YK88_BRENA|nr:DEKNAAC102354 [Brettanomyces naardenensis]
MSFDQVFQEKHPRLRRKRHSRPSPVKASPSAYHYDPVTSGTPLQRFLPRQLLVSSPFMQSPSGDSFPEGAVYYPPGAAHSPIHHSAAGQPYYYYDYYPQQTVPGQPVYMNVSNANSAPSLYDHGVPSRWLMPSLSEATLTSEEEHEEQDGNDEEESSDPNLSKRLAQDAEEKSSTNSPDFPLAYPELRSSQGSSAPEDDRRHFPHVSTRRTIRFSKVNESVKAKDILNLIEFGPIEHCKVKSVDGETVASLSFVSPDTASRCFAQLKESLTDLRTALDSLKLELDLAENDPVNPILREAVKHDGATRAICISNLPRGVSRTNLIKKLEVFGEIESLRYKLSRNSAFIYFTSIDSAVKCLEELSNKDSESLLDSTFAHSRISYAADKNTAIAGGEADRSSSAIFQNRNDSWGDICSTPSTSISSPRNSVAKIFKTSSSNRYLSQIPINASPAPAPQPPVPYPYATPVQAFPEYLPQYVRPSRSSFSAGMSPVPGSFPEQQFVYSTRQQHRRTASMNSNLVETIPDNLGNRTVYLGNLDMTTSEEDICNAVRGGILESVKLLRDRRVCFITFIYPDDAAAFIARATSSGVYVHSRCLKIGWGRNSGPLRQDIEDAVEAGASRNLYIGIVKEEDEVKESTEKEEDGEEHDTTIVDNHDEPASVCEIPEERTLRRDFSFFGGIEQINYFEDGRCAFVNFFNILSCMKAVDDFNGSDSERVHRSFHGRYRAFRIAFGKDRCGIPPKKKKKKRRRAGRKDEVNEEVEDEEQFDDSKFQAALNYMQISSKILDDKRTETESSPGETEESQIAVEVKTEVSGQIKNESISSKSSSEIEVSKDSRNLAGQSERGRKKSGSHERSVRKSSLHSSSSYRSYENQGSYYPGEAVPSPMTYYSNGAYYPAENGQEPEVDSMQQSHFYAHPGYSLSSPQLIPPSNPGYYISSPQVYYPMYPPVAPYSEKQYHNQKQHGGHDNHTSRSRGGRGSPEFIHYSRHESDAIRRATDTESDNGQEEEGPEKGKTTSDEEC